MTTVQSIKPSTRNDTNRICTKSESQWLPHHSLLAHLRGFLDYLQAECGLSGNTRKAYRRDLFHFFGHLEEIGCTDLSALNVDAIDGFLRYCRGIGLSTPSTARALAAVRMLCKYLVIQRILTSDVSSSVDCPKKWQTLPLTMSDSSVRQLIASPCDQQDDNSCRDKAILTLLYATGMRASEIAGLKLVDINKNLGIVRVLGKGSKERVVPVAADSLDALTQYIEGERAAVASADEPTIFLSRTGKPLAREDIFRTIRKYAKRLGGTSHVTPHTLRHCFATQLLSGGADLRSVQEMLGHADISTTQIYTHVDADRLLEIHRKFHPRS